ncbi:two-component sensor histidine kinase [Paenibacillus marchantiophytorum]|uniref:Heme sensor protein HssS n=1 Tax=Paenibacillus marchantiophytorum TaxID=1619310 RepID=A0ABQ1ESV7_9BACL|nr:HAMP domain-containing sensor histidine kinase [Paenibacillus marchantiophytorum]GFZ84904.1 two-component sensor histidine kinase [Paenibacillus marchantiophytorum]
MSGEKRQEQDARAEREWRKGRRERRKKPMTKHSAMQFIRGFLFALSMFTLIVGYWLALFYGTSWLYDYLNMRPAEVVVQLINSIGGMFLWGVTMAIMGRFFRNKQMIFFQKMIAAIRSMSRGDFNVSVEEDLHDNGPFNELVESINNMAVELGQLEKMRQEFISNVSHEIQSPLTSISGFSRALQNEQISPAERKHYLEIIEAESTRLSKLSDNLLKLTSLESQHHPFEPTSYRLDKQIRNHILACEPQWVDKEIEMDIELEAVALSADADLLSQVWTNLIHNAIKFAPFGGTIGVHITASREEAIVRISNNGIHISEEDLPHIFERFYKADKSRNRLSGGNGLGLSIVKKIIDMHGGSIAVESEPEKTTTFIVRLSLPN